LSLRAALLLLLFANLAFFGWAHFVDVAPESPRNDSIEHLPKLKLLSEVQSHPTAQISPPSPPQSNAAPAGSNAPAPAVTSVTTPRGSASPVSERRCVTVGPFNDPARVDQAANLLQQRGFNSRERTEESSQEGYWVYVGGLKSDSDQAAVMRQLTQNGISDAHTMPDSDKGRRVSVGFFNERDGADRRARTVQALGLKADIEKRTQSSPVRWIDVDIDSSGQSLPAEGLLALEEVGSRLEIKECPPEEKSGGDTALSAKAGAEAQPPTAPKPPAPVPASP
jgi:hypothetical protein